MQKMWAVAFVAGVVGSVAAGAQGQSERVTVPFSDPTRPGSLSVQLMDGSMTIRGTDRRDVLVEASGGEPDRSNRNDPPPAGLRRLSQRSGF